MKLASAAIVGLSLLLLLLASLLGPKKRSDG